MNTYVAKMTAVTDEEGWSILGESGFSMWRVLLERASGILCGSSQEADWEVGTMDMWVGVWALWSGWSSSLFSLVFHRTTSAVPSRGLPSESLQTQSTQHRLAVVRTNVSACHLIRKEVLSTIWCQPRQIRGRKKTHAMLKERCLLLVSEALSCVCVHAHAYVCAREKPIHACTCASVHSGISLGPLSSSLFNLQSLLPPLL